jgi:adenosylmethionine-8-amino-7-oxononanoate aminotransferase
MSATDISPLRRPRSRDDLQEMARNHLWLHFTRMGNLSQTELPIIVRGDGCHLEDIHGRRYFDAMAGMFAVQIGYSHGDEIAEAAAAQMRVLPYYSNWGYAHPSAIELATEVANLAPRDLNRVFFVSGGSEAVESAWKLARQYHLLRGERRWKAISRRFAYHGTTLGALSITGIEAARTPFEPLIPEVIHVSNTDRFRRPKEESEREFCELLLGELRSAVEQAGPETVAAIFMEPVQNAGGCLVPPEGYFQGVRKICDTYGILLCVDEVITGFGRLGEWFGAARYGIEPDLVTCAKGLSSAYGVIAALIARDEIMKPFLESDRMYAHGITFGGHPLQCAIALKNLEIMKRDRVLDHVRAREDTLRRSLADLLEIPIVGDLRGAGFFFALELVRDKETQAPYDAQEREWLVREFITPRLLKAGLIARIDDRKRVLVHICPPLIADEAEFSEMTGILGDVLGEASQAVTSKQRLRNGIAL